MIHIMLHLALNKECDNEEDAVDSFVTLYLDLTASCHVSVKWPLTSDTWRHKLHDIRVS